MRTIVGLTSLLVVSCSSGASDPAGIAGTTSTGGLAGATGGGGQGTIQGGAGSAAAVDCTSSSDKAGCACATANEVRSCQVGTCSGTQKCVTGGSLEFVSNSWSTCSAPTSGTCSPASGAGGAGGSSTGDGAAGTSTGDGTGGGGKTGDGTGGGSTGDGTGGGGKTGDGTGGGSTGDGTLPSLCTNKKINNEPEILVGYEPAAGQTVGANGQIKVWINDEGAPFISPNEKLDPTTGAVTTPGDRTAKAPDGYLWEPALYIAPQTAENGGTPHFPQAVKGWYNYPGRGKTAGFKGSATDPVPGNPRLGEKYTAEDVWDVSALNLPPGKYIAEFVIWDGDTDRAVGCISIVITP